VVMDKGRIEQIGTPGDVYDNPATAFVHGFIGESIVLPVEVRSRRYRLIRSGPAEGTEQQHGPGLDVAPSADTAGPALR
jgi:ABC-type Fe3+/spermidine/putrescine transport system ATPase subunit